MGSRDRQRGYLLVELLAAVVLLALAYGAVAAALAPRTDRAAEQALRSRLVSIDRAARSAAIAEGAVVLRIGDDGSTLRVVGDAGALLTARLEDRRCYLVDAGTRRVVGGVRYDRLGRADPYRVVVGLAETGSLRVDFGRYGVLEGEAER